MHRKKILRFGLSVAAALAVGLVGVALPAAAHDRDGNAPGPRGGWGTNWENPPGPRGGFGTSPDRVSRFHRFDRDTSFRSDDDRLTEIEPRDL